MKKETGKLTSASGTSEVPGAAKLTTSVSVSEIAEVAVMLFLRKGDLLLSGSGLKEAVAITIG